MLRGEKASGGTKRKRSSSCSTTLDPSLANKEMEKLLPTQMTPRKSRCQGSRQDVGGGNRSERITNKSTFLKTRSPCPQFEGQTILEQEAVTPAVAKDYKKRYTEFMEFVRRQKLSLRGALRLDAAFTSFLNNAFELGYDLSEASKFFAAVLDAHPGSGPKDNLPRSRRCLKGFHRCLGAWWP